MKQPAHSDTKVFRFFTRIRMFMFPLAHAQKTKNSRDTVTKKHARLGWLFKRGAGYQGPPPTASEKRPSNLSAEALLSKSGGSPTTTPKMKITNMLQGSAEKRRYFMLVTTRARTARQEGVSTGGPMAELRYYEKGRPESAKVKPKGSIILTADMQSHLEDNSILLITSTRVFYLRPDVPLDQASSAKARTSSSQWHNAIHFALSGLRAWELQGAAGKDSTPHPMGDRRSIRAVDLTAVKSSTGASTSPNAAKKEARKSKRAQGKNPLFEANGENILDFCELWALHGIEAYDRIVSHFGPVQTDLTRMRDHFASRLAQIKSEVSVLDESMTYSKEIVVKEQKTIGEVQRELHRTGQRQTLALRELSSTIETIILPALDKLLKMISDDLEKVVQLHANATTYVDLAKRALFEVSEKVDKLLEQQNANPAVSFEQEINDARQGRRDASQTLIITETKHAESISKAMKQLEELERKRLAGAIELLKMASEAETRCMTRLAQESNDDSILVLALNQIDPPKDIRASFHLLKQRAEKARPTGRHRRKNSLMGRVDLQSLSLEEA